MPVDTYAADKGYDDSDNHFYLEQHGLHSAIRLKRTRTEKKDTNKQVWVELSQTPRYQQGLKERYKFERKFGEAKQEHGLGRCRYLGKVGFAVQVFLNSDGAEIETSGQTIDRDRLQNEDSEHLIKGELAMFAEKRHTIKPGDPCWWHFEGVNLPAPGVFPSHLS